MTLCYNNHDKKVVFSEFHIETSQITMTTKVKITAEMKLSVQPGQHKMPTMAKVPGNGIFYNAPTWLTAKF